MIDTNIADRISDKIVGVINGELGEMRASKSISGTTLLAGQLLGLLATMRTAPVDRPASFDTLGQAAFDCLREMMKGVEVGG